MEEPRFAADRMLGRLARWLRLLGFDTAYRPELVGDRLLAFAVRERRVLLTRRRRLRPGFGEARVLRLESADFRQQLREIDTVLPLGGRRPPRCTSCNERLESEAGGADPPRPERREPQRCPRCRRTFWAGPQQRSVAAEIEKLGLRGAVGSPTIR